MTDVVIAMDIGGTGMKCALVDRAYAILHAERHPTGADRGPDAVVETILEVAAGLAETARAAGLNPIAVGLVVPGVIDETAGIAVWSANVGFRGVPLRDLVKARLGLPAALGHDVRAGGLAEARHGGGQGARRAWFVAIGTGIAAAYVIDGRVDSGAHGASGEIGHVVVRPDGPQCGCGARGCVEAIASASAVARQYFERSGVEATARDVVALAREGDPVASAVWAETIDALAEAGAELLDPLSTAVRARLTFQTMPHLVRATLGDEAGCLGAALIGLEVAS